jgi:O-antigen ligase
MPAQAVRVRNGLVGYMRFAAAVTTAGYSLGYSTVGFALLLGGAIWFLVSRRTFPWVRTPLDLPLMVFGVVLLASAALSPYRTVAAEVTCMLLLSGAVYYGSFAWILKFAPASRRLLLQGCALGGLPAAVVGLLYSMLNGTLASGHFIHPRAQIPRGVGPNGLGTTLALAGILALSGTLFSRGWRRVAWALCSASGLVGLVATGSRASLVGWVVGCAYLMYREVRRHPKSVAVIAFSGVLLLVGVTLATPQLANRLRDTVSDVEGNRVRIWQTSARMIAQRPVFGTGFGTFQTAYDRYRAPTMSPEPFAFNLWLNLAAETGTLGLAAALWIALEAVRAWRRQGAKGAWEGQETAPFGRHVVAALWIGLLVDQFADNTLFSISTSAALWLLLALLMVPERPLFDSVPPLRR